MVTMMAVQKRWLFPWLVSVGLLGLGCDSATFSSDSNKAGKRRPADFVNKSNNGDKQRPTDTVDKAEPIEIEAGRSRRLQDDTRDDTSKDDVEGKATVLSITGLGGDEKDPVKIMLQKNDGSTVEVDWPLKGAVVKVEGVCLKNRGSKRTRHLIVSTRHKGGVTVTNSSQCFVGLRESDESIHMGMEQKCDSNDFNSIDDRVATFTCPESELTITGLRFDESIREPKNWQKWVEE